jgi:glucose/arabinose dehydrogenase
MRRARPLLLLSLLVVVVVAVIGGCRLRGYLAGFLPSAAADVTDITLPRGFRIAVYAEVPNARQMALGPPGVVFVGSMAAGKVHAVVDRNGDHRADSVHEIAGGLNLPSGLAFRDGTLYVAAINRVLRFRDVARDLAKPPAPDVVTEAYPTDRHHGWKFIAFGPDGRLYVPVGAPCNVCEVSGLHATITRLDVTGGGKPEIVAHGVRNSVGFDFQPGTGELWFTDNGRDWQAEDGPPDELNRLSKPGEFFGFPYCHGFGIPDMDIKKKDPCKGVTMPVASMGPHAAALGMRFYSGNMFPKDYQDSIFVARHGSWNKSELFGFDVVNVRATPTGKNAKVTPFLTGFMDAKDNKFWGRPADVMQLPDGSLLVADDQMGAIYRITYSK